MKKENYITIQGWMITDLKLSGNKLIIYALIYGFSQDGKSTYNGSYDYIAKAVNITRRTVVKLIKELKEECLVKKIHHKKGNSYKVVKKLHHTGEKITPVASAKIAPNIYNNNNTNTHIAFEIFWKLYDYKKSKPITEKKWGILTEEEKKKIIEVLPSYVQNTNKDGTFPSRKHPSTWLNQKCWEDEIVIKKGKFNC